MLFNSIEFIIFLPIVFCLYWFVFKKNLKAQNVVLLVASYVFYGWWDWRFLSLIAFSSFVDYFIGLQLDKTEEKSRRKLLLLISICVNLGFLGFFKYYNFFVDSFVDAFTLFGNPISATRLSIILPVGISFYTFQTLSYSIDVYRKQLEPSKNIISFLTFVSFFPQLVAGPIERATNLLPQFYKKREFEYDKAINAIAQILWGLFKKILIADSCALQVNKIFDNYETLPSLTLVLGAFFFAFQIYGDFSGYSDIAIGTSRLFGFNLMKNFSFPYFSRDIGEFWRRWHISLSTWFRDYVYIPLGGSKGSKLKRVRNTFIIFIVSGIWHGANWTFVIWGALNAIYFLPLLLTDRNRKNIDTIAKNKLFPSIGGFFSVVITFVMTMFAWIFFRANNVSHAFGYISRIFTEVSMDSFSITPYVKTLGMVILFVMIEWIGKEGEFGIENTTKISNKFIQWSIYYILIMIIFLFNARAEQEFIYFQF